MSNQTRYGRTSTGSREIQHKSGRLTQSERLVLIVLTDNTTIDGLCGKLPSLRAERVELAIRRLLELGLAYEVGSADSSAISHDFTPTTISDFLRQSEADPVTVIATAEQINRTSRMKALPSESGLLGVPTVQPASGEARVSLSKVFPGGESPAYVQEDINQLRQRADEAIQRVTPKASARARPPEEIRPVGNPGQGVGKLVIGLLLGVLLTVAVIYIL